MSRQQAATRALIASIPENTWHELRSLHALVTKNRGRTPLDADSRIAVDAFYDLVKDTHETFGITLWSMAIEMGLNGRTIKHWMFSHGYIYNGHSKPPSLPTYRGVVSPRGHSQGGSYALGGKCRRGHELTATTLGRMQTQNYCRTCVAERRAS